MRKNYRVQGIIKLGDTEMELHKNYSALDIIDAAKKAYEAGFEEFLKVKKIKNLAKIIPLKRDYSVN